MTLCSNALFLSAYIICRLRDEKFWCQKVLVFTTQSPIKACLAFQKVAGHRDLCLGMSRPGFSRGVFMNMDREVPAWGFQAKRSSQGSQVITRGVSSNPKGSQPSPFPYKRLMQLSPAYLFVLMGQRCSLVLFVTHRGRCMVNEKPRTPLYN